MSSKRAVRRKSCEGKVRHATKDAAHLSAMHTRARGWGFVGAYKCQFCSGWHVGHPSAKQKQAFRAHREAKP